MSIDIQILSPVLLFCLAKFPVIYNIWYSEDTITNYQLNQCWRNFGILTVA